MAETTRIEASTESVQIEKPPRIGIRLLFWACYSVGIPLIPSLSYVHSLSTREMPITLGSVFGQGELPVICLCLAAVSIGELALTRTLKWSTLRFGMATANLGIVALASMMASNSITGRLDGAQINVSSVATSSLILLAATLVVTGSSTVVIGVCNAN